LDEINYVQQFIDYANQIDVPAFIISLLIITVGIKLLIAGLKKFSKIIIGIGLYLFTRGIITTGMILALWEQIPQILRTIFIIPL